MKTLPLDLLHRVHRSAWTMPVAAVAALVLFGINEAAYDRSTAALTRLGERGHARTQIQLLRRAYIDAETGQRGYLLTGRQEYLQPYQRSVEAAHQFLAWLQRYYAGDAEAAPIVRAVAEQGSAKLSELATTVEMHDAGRRDAWRELMLTDIGREKMEAVRLHTQQLLDLEIARVADERAAVLRAVRVGRWGIAAMTVLSLVALFVFLRQALAADRQQRRYAAVLQAERDRLGAQVARRTEALTDLARHLQSLREDEKARLARELHDELGALLTAAKLDAARLKRLIAARGPVGPEVESRLKHLNDSINLGIELKRRIIEDLRPSSLSNLGLVAALEILLREQAARTGLRITWELAPVELTDSAQITAFRLVQEALSNVVRHAQASSVRVLLAEQPRDGRAGVLLSVADDGRGFDPTRRHGTTHGLMGLRYRIEAEGGVMREHASPGNGMLLEAWMPRREPVDDAAADAGAPAEGQAPSPPAASAAAAASGEGIAHLPRAVG